MELDTAGRVSHGARPLRHTTSPPRFVVLVSGTVIYSKGDDCDVEKMAAEEIESQASATDHVVRLPAGGVPVPGSGAAAPMHIVGSAAGKVR